MNKKEKKPVKEKAPLTKADKISLIIGIVLCVILVPVLIFNCVSIITSVVTDKPPAIGKYTMLAVSTGSMEPLISMGDVILVEKIDPDTIEVGDIITYFEKGNHDTTPVTHRVLEIYEEDGQKYAITAGDANAAADHQHASLVADAISGEDAVVAKEKLEKQTSVLVDKKAPLDENGEEYTYIVYEPTKDKNPVKLDKDTIIGRYTYQEAPAFFVAFTDFMRTPWAWICFVVIPLAALITVEVVLKKKRDKKKSGEMDALLAELEALKAAKAAETNNAPADNAVEAETPKDADDAPKEN